MIEVSNLNFEYPGKQVLFDVSFKVAAGSVTAMVGPNGAGKTTLLRCLAALETPQGGSVKIANIDVAENPRAAHGMCGYLSDFFGLYDALTVRQCLVYAAWCHRLDGAAIEKRTQEVAELAQIADMLDKRAGVLSRGYRQRLGIALALVHDPKILILDEPASGMDPEARIGLSRLMRRLRAQGRTLIVSSHILNELEDYCTEMLVIRDGRVADHVKLNEHAARAGRVLEIRIEGLNDAHVQLLRAQPGVTAVTAEDGVAHCAFSGDAGVQQKILQALVANGVPVLSFHESAHTLQEAYMTVTGHGEAKA